VGFSDPVLSIGHVIHASPSKTGWDQAKFQTRRPCGQRQPLAVTARRVSGTAPLVPVTHRRRVDARRIHNRRVIHALMHASVLEERGGDAEVLLRVAFGADETTTSENRWPSASSRMSRKPSRCTLETIPERPRPLKTARYFESAGPWRARARKRKRQREFKDSTQREDAEGNDRGGKTERERERAGGKDNGALSAREDT